MVAGRPNRAGVLANLRTEIEERGNHPHRSY
jgi:hypothetical protein